MAGHSGDMLPLILPYPWFPCPTVALLAPGDLVVAMPVSEGRAARCMTPWMGEGSKWGCFGEGECGQGALCDPHSV